MLAVYYSITVFQVVLSGNILWLYSVSWVITVDNEDTVVVFDDICTNVDAYQPVLLFGLPLNMLIIYHFLYF